MANSMFSDHIPSIYGGDNGGSIFDIPKAYLDMLAAKDNGGAPATNSSSASSSSNEVAIDFDQENNVKSDDDQEHTTNKKLKAKKRKPKKHCEPRFAFLTKTEVDHLDDGYKWRKYGQKAVKNHLFPRSYYRCTSAPCRVKKVAERSLDDPSILVTTYEGTHIHPCPITRRDILLETAAYSNRLGGCTSSFVLPQLYNHQPSPKPMFNDHQTDSLSFNFNNNNTTTIVPSSYSYDHLQEGQFCPSPLPSNPVHRDNGFLEDMISFLVKKEEPKEEL